ncbi:hypothetical protein EC973_005198 [Apophysomyces ossiformis]|uniref:Uncharacterized protein n=1 Tax=Apophysomyces ossiformis TaxID=679940 RepID=A0A8H7BW18_9FUNG|nr:hypothetical protein EC973_005198 [Apophysomyces ossiformis]
MPELTEQEKLERRRQKRQQRILASAGNRLSKITGTAFPDRISPTPSPSTSASSLHVAEPTYRDIPRSPSPSPAVRVSTPPSKSVSSDTPRVARRSSDADPSEALGAPPPLEHTLDAIFSSSSSPFPMPSLAGAGAANEPNLNDLNDLFGQFRFGPALLASMQQQQQQPQETKLDTSEKYWKLLHFVSMIWLGIYAVYVEWTTAGSERFASLLFSNPTDAGNASYPAIHFGHMNTNSTLGNLAMQLPPPFSNIITVILRYRLIWSCLVQDCCILVFVIGMAEVLSAVL